jgi:phage terminase small subunit
MPKTKSIELTIHEQRFVDEYMRTGKASIAYVAAYGNKRKDGKPYSTESISKNGNNKAKSPRIAAEIRRRRAILEKRSGMTQERIINELARIALADIGEFVEFRDGGFVFRDMAELKRGKSRVVKSLSFKGGKITERKIEMHDKLRALELIGRHLGMFADPRAKKEVDEIRDAIESKHRKASETEASLMVLQVLGEYQYASNAEQVAKAIEDIEGNVNGD